MSEPSPPHGNPPPEPFRVKLLWFGVFFTASLAFVSAAAFLIRTFVYG